jgi:AraC-like DNA-binding protein
MSGSTTSVFSEPDDYQAALQRDGGFELVVTGRGKFRAELTRIALHRMQLVAGVESLARLAYITTPTHLVRVALLMRRSGTLSWAGMALHPDEIVMHGADQPMHDLTDGACRWRTLRLPASDLLKYGRALIGRTFEIPPGISRWRPDRGSRRHLDRLYGDAIRMSRMQPRVFAEAEASRGLEQELIAALIDCMRGETTTTPPAASLRHADIMARFEDVLRNYRCRPPALGEICAALKVSDRTLRAGCKLHLGMGPHRYLHLRQMQSVRRALRSADFAKARVAEIAERHGFNSPGRFAKSYREQFGELPSATKRRRTPR